MAEPRGAGQILCLANGNLNGRVTRLVADELHRVHGCAVLVISVAELNTLTRWPDERAHPHRVAPEFVDWAQAERLVAAASVLVLPPFWHPAPARLVALARRSGTPVVCVVADVGYGARKFDAGDTASLPDRICVSDPVTKELLLAKGIPASLLREVGSPYFDALLDSPPLPPPPSSEVRVGVLANPDGLRAALADTNSISPDGVLPAVHRALRAQASARLTVRLHPRQDPTRLRESLPLPPSASYEAAQPETTLPEFLAGQHLVAGSYSMGLMEARLLGRPAVSFQPPVPDTGQRREIFAAWDVPVATDEAQLATLLAERLADPGPPLVPEALLYRPGSSLQAISEEILAAQAGVAARARRPRETLVRASSAQSG